MRIVHIMRRQKFTDGVRDFYHRYFNNGEHEICYFNRVGEESLIDPRVSLPQKEVFFGKNPIGGLIQLYKCVKDCDNIVFHSYLYPYWLKGFFALMPGLVKKLVWIEWGADLYSWKSNAKGALARLKNYVEHRLRTRCETAVCIFPPDCDKYREEFPVTKAKVFYAPYCFGEVDPEFKSYDAYSRIAETRRNGETLHIMIGHCATPEIDHISTLNALKRFADKDIKILIPLSYGDEQYADKVQKYAETHFPGKVICLREMMPKREYFELLRRMDMAVFHTFRQIALGNIDRLMFRNVKVYMPETSVMYRHFVKLGAPVQPSEQLNTCDFADLLSEPEIADQKKFEKLIAGYSDMEGWVRLWEAVYNDLNARRM